MLTNNSITSCVLSLVLLAILTSCSSAPEKINLEQLVSDAVTQPDQFVSDKDRAAAQAYIRIANESQGKIRKQYLLKAAQLLYDRKGQADTEGFPLTYHDSQTQLVAARIALASNLPSQALELLPGNELLTLPQLIEAHTIRADALTKLGHYIDAISTQIEIEQLTETEEKKEQLNHSIWITLSALPTVNINNIDTTDRILRGWLDLALIMRNAQTNISWLQEDILDWGTKYPLHPVSNLFIDKLLTDYLADYLEFNNIAVFLPTEGKYQAVAEVVTNGLLSAYYEHDLKGEKPTIRFYNTGDENQNFETLYEQAIQDGSDVIIGPLDKAIINQLAKKKEINIPILTLNYAEEAQSTTDNLFQFGLLPEDEAKQVAELAIQQNKLSAAILVPKSEWGQRLANAFKIHYEFLGGEILSHQEYIVGTDDFSNPIRSLLNIDDSNARYKRLKRLLKKDLKFTPRRRQDIDMIFVAATHGAARSIIPAIKFHHAADIQTYATSHVYTGHIDRAADRDLNGLLFCDIPWTLVSKNKLKKTFRENWAAQEKYTRLYALGIDAYSLIHNLKYLKNNNHAYFVGETGNIIVDENNRLHRKLVWAKFIRGRPVYIDTTDSSIN